MGKDPVGYRFAPTGEELIIYYLMNKILGKIFLVDEAISEINLCSYEPKVLPSLARIRSKDLVWYFFCPIEYTTGKNKETKRSTGSGFWKPTGKDRKIRDKRGNGVEIGFKKTLYYHQGKVGKGVRTPWVIHEYHITCLPQNLRANYVICQVMYNGKDGDILYGNKSNEPSPQSLASVNTAPEVQVGNIFGMTIDDLYGINFNESSHSLASVSNTAPEVQVEQPGDEENILGMTVDDLESPVNPNTFFNDSINPNVQPPQTFNDEPYVINEDLLNKEQLEVEQKFNALYGGNFDDVFPNQELTMQENRNEHRPKKALSGFYVDSSSDSDSGSDAESISATSYKGTSSPGSSNVASPIPSSSSTDSCKDLQTSADSSISTKTKESQLISKQEVKQGTPRAVDASMDNNESSLVKTRKKGWFILDDAMERNRKNQRHIYFINMIIVFIILLALIVANIRSVLLPFKT